MSVSFANDGKGEGGWGVVDMGGDVSWCHDSDGVDSEAYDRWVEQRESRDIRFNSPR